MRRIHPRTPYVYAVLVDGIARYIGKGRGSRRSDHLREVRSLARRRAAGETVCSTLFYNRLTAAWLDGAEIETIVLSEHQTDDEAFEAEIVEIATRSGLWNCAPGGMSPPAGAYTHPDEIARKRAATTQQHTRMSAEAKAARSLLIREGSLRAKAGSLCARVLNAVERNPGLGRKAIAAIVEEPTTRLGVPLINLKRRDLLRCEDGRYYRTERSVLQAISQRSRK